MTKLHRSIRDFLRRLHDSGGLEVAHAEIKMVVNGREVESFVLSVKQLRASMKEVRREKISRRVD